MQQQHHHHHQYHGQQQGAAGVGNMELRLHSPAGADPIVYHWPLTSGSGNVSLDDCKIFYEFSLNVCLVLVFENVGQARWSN